MAKATKADIQNSANLMAMQLAKGSVIIIDDQFWDVQNVKAAKKSGNVIIIMSNETGTRELETHVSNRYPRYTHKITN